MNSTTGPASSGEDLRKHLDFIQTAVGRMAAASSVAKGWCLTVATAAQGYALTKDANTVALLGVIAVAMFGYLDTRYLREERKFRALYEDARRGHVEAYDLRTSAYIDQDDLKYDARCSWSCVLRSWSVWTFYLPLIAVGVAVLLRPL
jgi:hypothetical protein